MLSARANESTRTRVKRRVTYLSWSTAKASARTLPSILLVVTRTSRAVYVIVTYGIDHMRNS